MFMSTISYDSLNQQPWSTKSKNFAGKMSSSWKGVQVGNDQVKAQSEKKFPL